MCNNGFIWSGLLQLHSLWLMWFPPAYTHHTSATDYALPQITRLTRGTDTVVVSFSIHPNITGLTTDLRLQYRRTAVTGNMLVSLPPAADAEYRVTGLNSNTEYEFRLLSRVGTFEYLSNRETAVTLQSRPQTPAFTLMPISITCNYRT